MLGALNGKVAKGECLLSVCSLNTPLFLCRCLRTQEYMTVCSAGEKPLVLLYMLKTLGFTRTLCFASSVDATHR